MLLRAVCFLVTYSRLTGHRRALSAAAARGVTGRPLPSTVSGRMLAAMPRVLEVAQMARQIGFQSTTTLSFPSPSSSLAVSDLLGGHYHRDRSAAAGRSVPLLSD